MRSSKCSICRLDITTLNQIDRSLREGDSVLGLAKRWNVSRSSLDRHKQAKHHETPPERPPEDIEVVAAAKALTTTDLSPQEVMHKVASIVNTIEAEIEDAKAHGLSNKILEFTKVMSPIVKTLATLKGWISDGNQINIQLNLEREREAAVLAGIIKDCPHCRRRFLEQFEDVDFEIIEGESKPSDES